MKQYKVTYLGGESRYYPGTGVDYMLVNVENADGDEYELYAEISPSDLSDEQGNPAMLSDDDGESDWNPACKDCETLSIPYLIKAMKAMCKEIGIDPAALDYDGYDSDAPTYMMPGVEAEYRIR